MPVFEYECPRGHKFDKIVPIAEMDEYQECPGKVVKADDKLEDFKAVPCRAPAKRIVVPSRPAYVIIH